MEPETLVHQTTTALMKHVDTHTQKTRCLPACCHVFCDVPLARSSEKIDKHMVGKRGHSVLKLLIKFRTPATGETLNDGVRAFRTVWNRPIAAKK